jgi:hypothetical protein
MLMDKVIDTSVETRKEWVAPELKKVDIEQITANSCGYRDDGFYNHYS